MPIRIESPFYIAFFCNGAGLVLSVLHWPKTAKGLVVSALVAVTAALFLIVDTHDQFPVYTLFESLLAAAWMIQCWLVFRPGRQPGLSEPETWTWAGILILFCVSFCLDKTPAASGFNHRYPWVIGFHGFRVATLATLLVASAHFFAGRHLLKTVGAGASQVLHSGRNYLLLAAVLFLTAEYCGLVWCQNGWGDIWHWSPGFFQSTLILLYLMAAFHVPPKWIHARRARNFFGAMGGLFVLAMMLLRSLI
ncbi:MAG: hypothetical protein JEZ11_08310 [Desulfobacterales bacterium]|nr:hypothetical protein [Desulfobacterales bacterium]